MKLSQDEVGARAGILARRVSRIENGHVDPRLHEVVALAEVLGVPLDRLVFGEEPKRGAGRVERLLEALRRAGKAELAGAVVTIVESLNGAEPALRTAL